jgi:hypothetical protein
MDFPERYVYLDFLIDTNRINARKGLKYMNILERWYESDVISIEMPEVAQDEAVEGRDPNRTEKAYTYIATQTLAGSSEERSLLNQIKAILFPQGVKAKNERNDIEIVFTPINTFASSLPTMAAQRGKLVAFWEIVINLPPSEFR